jgi:hypothetical protein
MYDNTYSYRRNHFKPPEDKKEASAESILGALEKKTPGAGADAGGLPPAGEVPGLPPAGLPDAGAGGIPAPAAPPGAPPPAVPPPNN